MKKKLGRPNLIPPFVILLLTVTLLASFYINVPRVKSQTVSGLKVAYGHINSDGRIADFEGAQCSSDPCSTDFSVSHPGTGFYELQFSAGLTGLFNDNPAVVVNPGYGDYTSMVGIPSFDSNSGTYKVLVSIRTGNGSSNSNLTGFAADASFNFIAVGQSNNPTTNLAVAGGYFDYTGATNSVTNNWSISVSGGNGTINFNSGVFSGTPVVIGNSNNHLDCVESSGSTIYVQHDNCRYPAGHFWVTFIAVGLPGSLGSNFTNVAFAEAIWNTSSLISGHKGVSSASPSPGYGNFSFDPEYFKLGSYVSIVGNAANDIATGSVYPYCAGVKNSGASGAYFEFSGNSGACDNYWICNCGPTASNPSLGVSMLAIGQAPPPTISLSPTSLSFSAAQGGSNPAGQKLTVANSGPAGSTLNYSTTTTAAWLKVGGSNSNNLLTSGSSEDITVSADITGLAAGTYTDTITVSSPGATNDPQTVFVTLKVSASSPPPPPPSTGCWLKTISSCYKPGRFIACQASSTSVSSYVTSCTVTPLCGGFLSCNEVEQTTCVSAPASNCGGTITVNSVSSVTGAALAASWYFNYPTPIDPCSLSSDACGQLSAISSNSYSVPPGPYTILAPYSGLQAPSGYALDSITSSCGSTGPTATCNLAGGGNITFTLNWKPTPVLWVSFNQTNLQTSVTVTASSSQNATLNFYVKNVGGSGSLLKIGCTVNPPPGASANITSCPTGPYIAQ